MLLLGSLVVAFALYLAFAGWKQHRHLLLMQSIPLRVHVNGIRGKSSVTRLIAGALREGGVPTIAKTTGTAARLIIGHQEEEPIERRVPDIAEQRRTLSKTLKELPQTKAVVFECMAINPLYQKYLERKIMHSNIGVITNVREDHMDVLGKTLPQIAKSLTATVPYNGHLVTSEQSAPLLTIFDEACQKRHTKLHVVNTDDVSTAEIQSFEHFEFKENVAIALRVAKLAGIDRSTAFRGMLHALPDPGSFRLRTLESHGTKFHWANLFAVNDRESFIQTVNLLSQQVGTKLPKAVILNNRPDRPERVSQFLEISVKDIQADLLVTFGAYEEQVHRELRAFSGPKPRLLQLGDSSPHRNEDGTQLLERITREFNGQETLLLGAVNIHTAQATALLEEFSKVNQQ